VNVDASARRQIVLPRPNTANIDTTEKTGDALADEASLSRLLLARIQQRWNLKTLIGYSTLVSILYMHNPFMAYG